MILFKRLEKQVEKFYFLLIIVFSLTSSVATRFDPDGMHDGFHFLLANAASQGILPPDIYTRYGYLQPVLEGVWLRVFGSYILNLRILTLLFSFILVLGLFKLSRYFFENKFLRCLPILIWLATNPINHPFDPITQNTWPNLLANILIIWIWVIFFSMTNKETKNKRLIFLLGYLIGLLPFTRIQFTVSSLFFVLIVTRTLKKRDIFVFLFGVVLPTFNVLLIHRFSFNKFLAYFKDVTFVGVSERERVSTPLYIIKNLAEYLTAVTAPSTVFLLLLFCGTLTIQFRKGIGNRNRILLAISFCLLVAISLVMGMSDEFRLWSIENSHYWFVGLCTLVIVWSVIKIYSPLVSLQDKKLELSIQKLEIKEKHALLFASSVIPQALPPFMANGSQLRTLGMYLLLPALYFLHRPSGIKRKEVFTVRQTLSFSIAISLILSVMFSVVGSVKYTFLQRFPVEQSNVTTYKGMTAPSSDISDRNSESRVLSIISQLPSKNRTEDFLFDCPVGIYHTINTNLYGDLRFWYRFDFPQRLSRVESLEYSALNNGAPKYVVGCAFKPEEFSGLQKNENFGILRSFFLPKNQTYSFVAEIKE